MSWNDCFRVFICQVGAVIIITPSRAVYGLEVMGRAQGLALLQDLGWCSCCCSCCCLWWCYLSNRPYVQPNQRRSLPALWDIIKLWALCYCSAVTKKILMLDFRMPAVTLSSIPCYLKFSQGTHEDFYFYLGKARRIWVTFRGTKGIIVFLMDLFPTWVPYH